MGRWVGGWVDGWMDGWTDGWTDEWTDGWVGGYVDGRIGKSLDVSSGLQSARMRFLCARPAISTDLSDGLPLIYQVVSTLRCPSYSLVINVIS